MWLSDLSILKTLICSTISTYTTVSGGNSGGRGEARGSSTSNSASDFAWILIIVIVSIMLVITAFISTQVTPATDEYGVEQPKPASSFKLHYATLVTEYGPPIGIYVCEPAERYPTPLTRGYVCTLDEKEQGSDWDPPLDNVSVPDDIALPNLTRGEQVALSQDGTSDDGEPRRLTMTTHWKLRNETVFSWSEPVGLYQNNEVIFRDKINITMPPYRGWYSLSFTPNKGFLVAKGTNRTVIYPGGEKIPKSVQYVRVYDSSELYTISLQESQHRFSRFEWLAIAFLWFMGIELCLSILQYSRGSG